MTREASMFLLLEIIAKGVLWPFFLQNHGYGWKVHYYQYLCVEYSFIEFW